VVDFSFVRELVKDRYTPDFGKPAEDPEFMLRLCLLQYLYGGSDREVIENALDKMSFKYFLGLAGTEGNLVTKQDKFSRKEDNFRMRSIKLKSY
jgi:transposase